MLAPLSSYQPSTHQPKSYTTHSRQGRRGPLPSAKNTVHRHTRSTSSPAQPQGSVASNTKNGAACDPQPHRAAPLHKHALPFMSTGEPRPICLCPPSALAAHLRARCLPAKGLCTKPITACAASAQPAATPVACCSVRAACVASAHRPSLRVWLCQDRINQQLFLKPTPHTPPLSRPAGQGACQQQDTCLSHAMPCTAHPPAPGRHASTRTPHHAASAQRMPTGTPRPPCLRMQTLPFSLVPWMRYRSSAAPQTRPRDGRAAPFAAPQMRWARKLLSAGFRKWGDTPTPPSASPSASSSTCSTGGSSSHSAYAHVSTCTYVCEHSRGHAAGGLPHSGPPLPHPAAASPLFSVCPAFCFCLRSHYLHEAGQARGLM